MYMCWLCALKFVDKLVLLWKGGLCKYALYIGIKTEVDQLACIA